MNSSYLYVIGPANGNIKIGYSEDPESRLGQLQTGNDQTLILHYTAEADPAKVQVLEKIIHRQLRHLKIRGEWFKLTAEEAQKEIDFAIITYSEVDNLERKFKMKLLR